ncbi:hypothetical protein ACUW8V_001286 [Staphylococcus epidermidis]
MIQRVEFGYLGGHLIKRIYKIVTRLSILLLLILFGVTVNPDDR